MRGGAGTEGGWLSTAAQQARAAQEGIAMEVKAQGELKQALTGKLNILRRLWGWERAASTQGQEGRATECNQAPGAASSPQPRRAQELVSPTSVQPQGTGHKRQP